MALDNIPDDFLSVSKLSNNRDFYNNVFKKTERIASVVFYVLSHIDNNQKTELHYKNLSDRAMQLHEAALQTLTLHEYEAKDGLYTFAQALVALESSLHLAVAARVVSPPVEQVLLTEIDTVQRYVSNHYLKEVVVPSIAPAPAASTRQRTTSAPKKRATTPSQDISSGAATAYPDLTDRAERIKTVLEAAGEASIKDVSEIIRDCSEKTIQRELNSLIEKGEVKRVGERRWSRYMLA